MTKKIGKILGEIVPGCTVIALNGELGAGKTVFVRGIAEGLRVVNIVNSPSYVIMNLYKGRLELYHFDFYRLKDDEELEELGLEEYFYAEKGLAIIEWANKFPHILPPARLEIEIMKDPRDLENTRILHFKQLDKTKDFLIEELKKNVASCP
ncbi:MAG TPA: tRNA (adenosine(37)-N6)-threonylcarbamoyltransferase complex ATPase subunit type 1 TsaE [Firmicutes bacterium]|nr:tRNA (adenosine(37)-N6)-threonylcarbamoyltransferase complex ATPase subunit type 1 TsaE [Bacillota bacterium]